MISLDEIKNKPAEEVFQYILTMQNKIEDLSYQLNLAKIHRFGKRADAADSPLQANLFDEAIEPDNVEEIQEAESTISVSSFQRKKPGRKPLPANLPRVETIHDLVDEDKVCHCGSNLTEIGSDKSEQLEYIPATLQVQVHVRKKYACKQCEETIKTAPLPKQPIPKSIASPSLLANIITSKVAYHLPLYRQEQIFRSLGIYIPRNTMSYWFIKSAELLQPLVRCLEKTIQQYDVGYSDETVVQVLKEPGKHPRAYARGITSS